MKKYKSKLTGLLRVRQIELDKAQGKLAKIASLLNQCEAEIAKLLEQRELTFEEIRKGEQGAIDMKQMIQQQRYLNILATQELAQKRLLQKIYQEYRAEQRLVAEAKKQLQAVDSLEQQRISTHEQAVKREEMHELDEVGRNLLRLGSEAQQ